MKQRYSEEVLPKRAELFGTANQHATPTIAKVVVNARVRKGGSVDEETVMGTLEKITGQKPISTKARLSISNFKIRQGMVVGAKVTLRSKRAYDFLDRLIHVTIPRIRDFSGLSTASFDGKGNYTIGIAEHNVFPEVANDDVAHLHGLEITITTTADNDKDGLALLTALGFPFKKQ